MEHTLSVNFEIKTTKRDAVSKASMKKVLDTLVSFKRASYTVFITDSTNRMFCFDLVNNGYGFELSCEFTEDETVSGDDVYTSYSCDWENGQHRHLDHAEAYYETERF